MVPVALLELLGNLLQSTEMLIVVSVDPSGWMVPEEGLAFNQVEFEVALGSSITLTIIRDLFFNTYFQTNEILRVFQLEYAQPEKSFRSTHGPPALILAHLP
jgi:hypothetical protein